MARPRRLVSREIRAKLLQEKKPLSSQTIRKYEKSGLVLGALIDGISMILITMPIVFPIVTGLGFDPVWFGIIVVKVVELGCITPPVGLNVFVVKAAVPEMPLGQVFLGAIPFVLMELLIIGLLVAFPKIALLFVP